MSRRWLTRLLVVLAMTWLVAPASARSLDDIIKSGTIRVGVNPNFPPNSSYGAQNQLEGFDIDIGNQLAAALKVKAAFVPTETAQRVPFLVADKIDISLGALTRTVERSEVIDYTLPLHTEVMAVLTTDKVAAANWKQLDDPKYTLADMRGNWTVDWLKQNLPKAKLDLVDTIADTVRIVAQGRADAIVENIDFFMKQTKNYPDIKWKVLPETINVAYDCVGVSKGNDSLRQTLNIALFDMESSDFVNQAWTKWYGAPPLVKVVPNPYF